MLNSVRLREYATYLKEQENMEVKVKDPKKVMGLEWHEDEEGVTLHMSTLQQANPNDLLSSFYFDIVPLSVI